MQFFRNNGHFIERTSIFSHVWVPVEDSLVAIDCVSGGRSSSTNYEEFLVTVSKITLHQQESAAS